MPTRFRPARLVRPLIAATLLAALSACTAFSSLNSAAASLDAFELQPLPPMTGAQQSSRILFVAEPTMSGGAGSERIVVKPTPLAVAFLPDGRWIEAAPVHIRNLLARSFANTGALTMVTTGNVGPLPDFTLLSDVGSFQAEVLPGNGAPTRVVISLTLTLARDADGRLIASRRFSRTAEAPGTEADEIVAAFDAAMQAILGDAVPWGLAVMTGRTPRV